MTSLKVIFIFIVMITLTSGGKLDNNTQKTPSKTESHFSTETIDLYLLPVGEGLSMLFHSQEMTFLFDTGNRFRQFDAGKQIILPTLRSLGVNQLDQIILSLQNQQHVGGTRMIRTKYPNAAIVAYPKLLWLMEDAQDCRQYDYNSAIIEIHPLTTIENSCAFHLKLFNQISLYLLSDITEAEWQLLNDQSTFIEKENIYHQIILFPNQGQRYFPLEVLQKQPHIQQTLLFSTRKLSTKLQDSLIINSHLKGYNAYYGTIHLTVETKNAKSSSKFRIEHYADQARYWWLQPSIMPE